MKRICVDCGSSTGSGDAYKDMARQLGKALAANDIELVYGGANIGLMGRVADSVLENNGKAIGVVPTFFAGDLGHRNLTELHIVNTMHERKKMMFDLSDGFIALPGGFGTLEEIFEIITWAQLGHHEKPCGFLDVCGYYSKLIDFLDHTVSQRFVRQEHRDMVIVADTPDGLLSQFYEYKAPKIKKWIDR